MKGSSASMMKARSVCAVQYGKIDSEKPESFERQNMRALLHGTATFGTVSSVPRNGGDSADDGAVRVGRRTVMGLPRNMIDRAGGETAPAGVKPQLCNTTLPN